MPVLVLTATICKFKMAVRYHVGSDWWQASCAPTYRLVCFCQFVYFLHQYIWNYGSLVIFTVAIFLNSSWRPDIMSVVIGTKFLIKLSITKYMCANLRAFVISIF